MSMNEPSESVSFLEEVDISLDMRNIESLGHSTTTADVTIQPIVLRASPRDIDLIKAIVTRGMEQFIREQAPGPEGKGPVKSMVPARVGALTENVRVSPSPVHCCLTRSPLPPKA